MQHNVNSLFQSFILKLTGTAALFLFSFSVLSQPSETIKYLNSWKIKGFAKNSERIGDIYSATDYYEALKKRFPDNNDNIMALANLYRQSRNYTMALENYSMVYEKDKDVFPDALFYKALMEKMTGEYDKAIEDFQKFQKVLKGTNLDPDFKKKVKNEIDGCLLAKNKMDSALKVIITHLDTSINKAHAELSPFPVTKDKFIYSSMPADKVEYFDPNNDSVQLPVRQFYVAKRKGDNWQSIGSFTDGPFNIKGQNTGNGTFSPDGNRFYFTRCKTNWKNKVVCAIYLSKKNEGKWSEPEKLNSEINDPKYTSTQPAVGNDSKYGSEVLYFVSDRKGGKGGNDIWYSVYNEKKEIYKTPKNAGNRINTISDEVTPFYDMSSRTLYFSSNGWPSLGGFDVFTNTGEMSSWLDPVNIGYPVNSSTDDYYFVVGKNKEEGFFASNRLGGITLHNPTCCDDIYEYRWTDFIRVGVSGKVFAIKDSSIYLQLEKQIFENKFISDDDPFEKIDPLPDQAVNLFLIGNKNERVFIKSCRTSTEGEYFFDIDAGKEYKLVVENYGMFNKELNIDTRRIIKSDTIRLDAIYINMLPKEPIVIKNIYYDFNDWKLTSNAKSIIDSTLLNILLTNPRIIVEIGSHTDNIGDDNYNMKLSQKRAESVVKYLIDRGVEKERLLAKGYGESKFIAPNEKPDGSDNPEGRQMNRRTEFRIIGSLDQYSKIIYQE